MRTSRLSKYSIVKLYQNAAKMRPARRRPEVVSNPSLNWTRDYEYPTSFGADSGGSVAVIRMITGQRASGIRPFSPVSYELSVNGKVVGTFENERKAFGAAEQMLAPQSPESIPDRPVDAALKEASTTMGAALLSGTSELVSKETAISESKWSQYQRDIFAFIRDGVGNAIIEAVAGSGKCLGRGTPVMLHDGRVVPVEAVQHGDLLMGPDSQPRRVLSTNTGRGPLYKIVPVKGDPWVCNDVHILTLQGTNRHMGEVKDVALCDLIDHAATTGCRMDRDWKLMRAAVDFPAKEVPVDPYLLGLWIGDGTTSEASITNCEPEIRKYCRDIAARYQTEVVERHDEKDNTWNIRFRMGARGTEECGNRSIPNVLRRFFLDECVIDGAKSIPANYLTNTREVRLALLAGIIDTDGFVQTGTCEVTTVSAVLCEQILFLARSLGLAAYTSEKIATIKSIGFTGLYHRITLSGDLAEVPCLVPRRQCAERRQIKRVNCTGFDAIPLGEGEYFGFTLDGDGRFLLGDFTVTHNTTTIMESLNYIPRNKSVLILAFNKSIELELQQRVPEGHNVRIKTLTAFGFTFLRQYWKNKYDKHTFKKRDSDVVQDGIGSNFSVLTRTSQGLSVIKKVSDLVALCQSYLVSSDDEITAIQNDHAILVDERGDNTAESWSFDASTDVTFEHKDVLRWVKASLRAQLKQPDLEKTISFRDMVYVSAMHPEWPSSRTYDFVFVDETQDTDVAQLSLVMRAVKPGGRIICVGDRRQSIYRFRGADDEAMPRMQKRLDAKLLPLSVSYRVTQCSALEARKIVPKFEVPEGTPPGICAEVTAERMIENWQIGDIVIGRVNAPLISLALIALSQGKLPLIMGEGDQIQKVLNRVIEDVARNMSFKDRSVEAMEPLIDEWAENERQRVVNRIVQQKIDRKWDEWMVVDERTGEERSNFLDGVEEESDYVFAGIASGSLKDLIRRPDINSVADLKDFVKKIAPDDEDLEGMSKDPEKFKRLRNTRIVFTSAHRIKGGEGRRIFVLEETFGWGRNGKIGSRPQTEKEKIQEQNLWYVAVTRVMHQRADEKKGITARDGEMYYVTRLDNLVGRLPGQDFKKKKKRYTEGRNYKETEGDR